MRFYEYEAKALLREERRPDVEGRHRDDGRRGGADRRRDRRRGRAEVAGADRRPHEGGRREVRVVGRTRRAQHAEHILKLEISGQTPRCVLVEAKQPVKKEYYAGIIYDAVAKLPVAIFSDMGGIDIEEVAEKHPEHVARVHFSTFQPLQEFKFKELVASLGISGNELNQLSRIVSRLAKTFLAHGLTLAEINPLAQLEDGSFIALDSHCDMEEEARDQQKARARRAGHRPRGDAPGARSRRSSRSRGARSTRRTTAASPGASWSSTATSAA